MIVDLTYACSMGCSHCFSSCTPDGTHMTMETLNDVLSFVERNNIKMVGFSGGEIYENPNIEEMLDIISDYCIRKDLPFMLITNGRILSSDIDKLEHLKSIRDKIGKNRFIVQVTDDDRFYPTKLSDKQRYRLEKLGIIIDPVPHASEDINKCLYPQGRALENFDERYWNTKGPQCSNCIMMAKQIPQMTFKELNDNLISVMKLCTPTIDPNGNIRLGESQHCIPVASIYDSDETIMNAIRNCKCNQCKISEEIMKKNNPVHWAIFRL